MSTDDKSTTAAAGPAFSEGLGPNATARRRKSARAGSDARRRLIC